jgi:hypothetical protein
MYSPEFLNTINVCMNIFTETVNVEIDDRIISFVDMNEPESGFNPSAALKRYIEINAYIDGIRHQIDCTDREYNTCEIVWDELMGIEKDMKQEGYYILWTNAGYELRVLDMDLDGYTAEDREDEEVQMIMTGYVDEQDWQDDAELLDPKSAKERALNIFWDEYMLSVADYETIKDVDFVVTPGGVVVSNYDTRPF